LLSSPPPSDPEDILGLIESVHSIWFNSDRANEYSLSDEITTTNASTITLDSVALEDDTTYHIHTSVVGFQCSYEFAGTFYRAGGVALMGGQTVIHSFGSFTAVFDVDSNNVRVRVSGAGRWRSSTKIMRL